MAFREDNVEILSEGAWLGKSRRTFYLSNRGFELLHRLSLELGLTHSSVLELAIRLQYQEVIGPVPRPALATRRFKQE